MNPFLTLLTPATAFSLHVIAAYFPSRSRQRSAGLISAINAALWSLLAFIQTGFSSQSLFIFLTASFFSLFYFLLWNCTETARRVRILVSLYRNESLSNYTPELMIRERVLRLHGMGSLHEDQGRYFPKRGILLFSALFFKGWRNFFGCEKMDALWR